MTVDVARLVELTTQSKPEAATHWSTRTLADAMQACAGALLRRKKSGAGVGQNATRLAHEAGARSHHDA